MEEQRNSPFPLFKGCTRVPTVAGVPMIPLMLMLIIVASIAMSISLWWWFLAPRKNRNLRVLWQVFRPTGRTSFP